MTEGRGSNPLWASISPWAWAPRGYGPVVSIAEHHSNFLPWQELAAAIGCIVKIMPLNQQGVIDVEILKYQSLFGIVSKVYF